jgi:hypothetical protein
MPRLDVQRSWNDGPQNIGRPEAPPMQPCTHTRTKVVLWECETARYALPPNVTGVPLIYPFHRRPSSFQAADPVHHINFRARETADILSTRVPLKIRGWPPVHRHCYTTDKTGKSTSIFIYITSRCSHKPQHIESDGRTSYDGFVRELIITI